MHLDQTPTFYRFKQSQVTRVLIISSVDALFDLAGDTLPDNNVTKFIFFAHFAKLVSCCFDIDITFAHVVHLFHAFFAF